MMISVILLLFVTVGQSLSLPLLKSGGQLTSSVHLKLGTDENWSLTYDSSRRPVQRVRVEIECPVEAMLASRHLISKQQFYLVNWYKDVKKLSMFSRRVRVDDVYLTIRNANQYDSGVYFCDVITGTGVNFKSPKLTLNLTDGKKSFR